MPRRARSRRRAGRPSPASLAIIALLLAVGTEAAGVGGYDFVTTPYTWSESAVAEGSYC